MKTLALFVVSSLTMSTLAVAKTYTCKYDRKDPKGTIEEVMIYGFDYSLSRQEVKVHLSRFDLGAAKGYATEGAEFPAKTTGTFNPNYGVERAVAKRHEGYSQYRDFAEVKSDVLFSRFEVLLDADSARVLITTNDGTYTEELFSCFEK